MSLPLPLLFLLSFLLALCSLAYELVLAQILAATLGGTLLRYCTVIGLFTLSLGLGSLLYGRVQTSTRSSVLLLFWIEIALTLTGFLGPLAIVFLEPFRLASFSPWLFEGIFYFPVVMIGLLSGFELPLLLSMAPRSPDKFRILSADYFGMFAGSLTVPLVLYPLGGPFFSSFSIGLLNFVGALSLIPFLESRERRQGILPLLLTGSLAFFLLGTEHLWLSWMQKWFISS